MPSHVDRQLFVVFGGTGDLAKKKLLPALHRALTHEGWEDGVAVLAVGTTRRTDAEFRSLAEEALVEAGIAPPEAAKWCDRLHYAAVQGTPDRDLDEIMRTIEKVHDLPGNRVFYLALPPSAVRGTVEAIGSNGLAEGGGWSRLVVEKPFGHDLDSARALNDAIHRYFPEAAVYRIDHYLAKETVRNLLVFRFANSLFERTWNRDHIASVEITVAEDGGLDGRGRYYDESGAIRDVVQNHMTQLLTLIAMEPPVDLSAGSIRAEKIKALRSMKSVPPDTAVVGQFTGYHSIPGVREGSTTPTFAALRLHVDNWRWQGVPFLMRTGKLLPRRVTRIVVRYRKPPVCLFHGDGTCPGHENLLHMTLQPDEGFDLFFAVKEPGDRMGIRQIPLTVRYGDWLGDLPDAYHTLLLDILEGDQSLFVHADEVEESWRVYGRILDQGRPDPYAAGSPGPEAADRLAADSGSAWTEL